MKILTQVYTATVTPYMEYASNAWSSAARSNLDQLTKIQNAGLRNYHMWYGDHPHLRVGKDSRPAVTRGQERGKTPAPKQKDEEAFFTPIIFQV